MTRSMYITIKHIGIHIAPYAILKLIYTRLKLPVFKATQKLTKSYTASPLMQIHNKYPPFYGGYLLFAIFSVKILDKLINVLVYLYHVVGKGCVFLVLVVYNSFV